MCAEAPLLPTELPLSGTPLVPCGARWEAPGTHSGSKGRRQPLGFLALVLRLAPPLGTNPHTLNSTQLAGSRPQVSLTDGFQCGLETESRMRPMTQVGLPEKQRGVDWESITCGLPGLLLERETHPQGSTKAQAQAQVAHGDRSAGQDRGPLRAGAAPTVHRQRQGWVTLGQADCHRHNATGGPAIPSATCSDHSCYEHVCHKIRGPPSAGAPQWLPSLETPQLQNTCP